MKKITIELESFGTRLAYAMRETGNENQTAFARKIGVTPQTIQYLVSKGKGSVHSSRIAEALGINVDWLVYGDGEMLLEKTLDSEEHPPSDDDYILIPQYDASAACGKGHLNDYVTVKGGLAFRRDWIKSMGWQSSHLSVLYAVKDSMSPTINDGAIVLVNSDELTPKSGQIYLVSWFDEARIKRIFREGNHCYRLSSDNTNKTVYPDERVDLSTTHDVSILGRVVWQAGTL